MECVLRKRGVYLGKVVYFGESGVHLEKESGVHREKSGVHLENEWSVMGEVLIRGKSRAHFGEDSGVNVEKEWSILEKWSVLIWVRVE